MMTLKSRKLVSQVLAVHYHSSLNLVWVCIGNILQKLEIKHFPIRLSCIGNKYVMGMGINIVL